MLLLAGLATLSACAASADRYPSLDIRDVERVQGVFQPSSGEDTVLRPEPAAPATLANLDLLVERARSSHQRFVSAVPETTAHVSAASGLDPDSNEWSVAQVALADLDSLRSEGAVVLGDLDLLYADASIGFTERSQIDAAREQVVMLITEQDRVLSQLRGVAQ